MAGLPGRSCYTCQGLDGSQKSRVLQHCSYYFVEACPVGGYPRGLHLHHRLPQGSSQRQVRCAVQESRPRSPSPPLPPHPSPLPCRTPSSHSLPGRRYSHGVPFRSAPSGDCYCPGGKSCTRCNNSNTSRGAWRGVRPRTASRQPIGQVGGSVHHSGRHSLSQGAHSHSPYSSRSHPQDSTSIS